MNKQLRIVLWVAGIYLVITYVIGGWVEVTYRRDLTKIFSMLGKDYFKNTARATADLTGDAELHRYANVLKFTPPAGWIVSHRLARLEEKIIFLSKNDALPESQRFSDKEEARSFGVDPSRRTDEDVVAAILNVVRE